MPGDYTKAKLNYVGLYVTARALTGSNKVEGRVEVQLNHLGGYVLAVRTDAGNLAICKWVLARQVLLKDDDHRVPEEGWPTGGYRVPARFADWCGTAVKGIIKSPLAKGP